MSNELKSTFTDLDGEAFRVYAEDLVEGYPTPAERQRLQAYLLQTIALDRVEQVRQQGILNINRFRSMQHQEVLEDLVVKHSHDYSRFSSLFTDVTKTDQEILDYLKSNNAEVFVKDRTITGDALLEGDGTKFCGLNLLGTALGGDLTPSVIVNGRIVISGADVTLEGLHFKYEAKWVDGGDELPMVSFTGGTNTKLKFKNCVFENLGSDVDARFPRRKQRRRYPGV